MKRLTISKNRSRAQRDSLACFCCDNDGQIFTCVQTIFVISDEFILFRSLLFLAAKDSDWRLIVRFGNKKETIVTNVNLD